MVIPDLDASWPEILRELDLGLRRLFPGASVHNLAEAIWRLSWRGNAPALDVFVEAQEFPSEDPFDTTEPERVLVITRVLREVSREELSDEVIRGALAEAADRLYLRPCARAHPDGSRKLVLALTHTVYPSTLDEPELIAVLEEARASRS